MLAPQLGAVPPPGISNPLTFQFRWRLKTEKS